jgi:hypothetical protein
MPFVPDPLGSPLVSPDPLELPNAVGGWCRRFIWWSDLAGARRDTPRFYSLPPRGRVLWSLAGRSGGPSTPEWNGDSVMAELYIMDPDTVTFTVPNLHSFATQFRNRRMPLEELVLCKRIAEVWSAFVSNADAPELNVELPMHRRVFLPKRPPEESGVYAIFCDGHRGERSCFYVGMSASNHVRRRLQTHLGKDVLYDWAGAFAQLRERPRLWLCTAVVPDWQRNEPDRQRLKLLEACLTVHLRGWWHGGE